MSNQIHGIYRAVVSNNADPLAQRRLLLQVPQLLGTSTTSWAEPTNWRTDSTYVVPGIGTMVFAFFVGGDPASPAYLA